MEIKAIQTRYKGYHFRSRLEARWAVFFDTLGIEWAYEEEGFETETSSGVERYLPDFRIGRKTSGLFVEVKGDNSWLTSRSVELDQLHDWGGILPSFSDSLGSARGLIVLGDIPLPEQKLILHPIMQHRKGMWKSWCLFTGNIFAPVEVLDGNSISKLLECKPEAYPKWSNAHKSVNLGRYFPYLEDAYRSARSARFEHGESGTT
jgi:hypothetical protein